MITNENLLQALVAVAPVPFVVLSVMISASVEIRHLIQIGSIKIGW